MNKIGILTFHYSNNYGGVLQALSLYRTIKSLNFEVEIINYIPSSYKPYSIFANLGVNKQIYKNSIHTLNVSNIVKKIKVMNKHSKAITLKFDQFRINNIKVSRQVDEHSLETILNNYSVIIVGSDQVWNPSQRKSPIYFLDFGDKYLGKKISYAPDSTIKDVNCEELSILKKSLSEFNHISVRNDHSFEFVKTVIGEEAEIVADPTLLYDFNNFEKTEENNEEYILTYILGQEIEGSHEKAIKKIRNKYGNIPVYSVKIPTMNFELSPFADKVFYDLDPDEWVSMFKNAKFVYTDSFHGVLFSLKFHKPFIAFYTEELRATRFIDLGERYGIAKYIVQNTDEIDEKGSLEKTPDFACIDKIITDQRGLSMKFLEQSLQN
jgi:polysaccharide pyruvyl transferase WcaK-like protein